MTFSYKKGCMATLRAECC